MAKWKIAPYDKDDILLLGLTCSTDKFKGTWNMLAIPSNSYDSAHMLKSDVLGHKAKI